MQEARQNMKSEVVLDNEFYEKFFKNMTTEQLETEVRYQSKHGSDVVLSIALREMNRREINE